MISKNSIYFKQAELLLKVLPIIRGYPEFALKGGTAINFFIREMPRLSVDIDLVYLPVNNREDALNDIDKIIRDIAGEISIRLKAQTAFNKSMKPVSKLMIRNNEVLIKLEVNTVIRGAVLEPGYSKTTAAVNALFESEAEMLLISRPELYASKICAALDRQHPRDLFDIKLMFEAEGKPAELMDCFLFYLISHNRPFHEILEPGERDLSEIFNKEFLGMVTEKTDLNDLYITRSELVEFIKSNLTLNAKKLLISIMKLEPEWNLIANGIFAEYPSVKWKLSNLKLMDKRKRLEQLKRLESVF
ncbi:MAG: nucleotidyl transferase AbiEii/AbiGii toxin family protein [Ignavibacteriaceae bacterium]|nr:nucleotidyl transferase AbiEii/AbiGii toxin family protein [Ignavibacteriaceae bacterium]NUM72124.1 nucleotidyl transferase AbiEii/AbiGii toxin family protein [Ignavibacteriaceae bacterium]